jgi:hypothetical protein
MSKIMPSENEKHKKFRALAERRTNAAIDAVLRIGKLSNRNAYEYDDAEVKKILKALRETVAEVEARFAAPRTKPQGRFTL